MKIIKYEEAFDLINVTITDKTKEYLRSMQKEGYSERSICYCIWKSHDKIMKFRDDARFYSILSNEIRKYGFKN